MDQFSCDVVVVGAGVVGLAVARALALAGRDTVVLEQHARIGTETSARSSEVIHAGLYYAPGSLKARLCVAGRDRLYDFCQSHGVGHNRIGKLIVAMDADQSETLAGIQKKAAANGVTDVRLLDRAGIAALEPELAVAAALFSPSTGIIDSHQYMLALLGDLARRLARAIVGQRRRAVAAVEIRRQRAAILGDQRAKILRQGGAHGEVLARDGMLELQRPGVEHRARRKLLDDGPAVEEIAANRRTQRRQRRPDLVLAPLLGNDADQAKTPTAPQHFHFRRRRQPVFRHHDHELAAADLARPKLQIGALPAQAGHG